MTRYSDQGVISIVNACDLAASISASDRKEMRIGDKRQWYFTVTVRIPDVNHKVRIVILWRYRNDDRPCKILVTNRITWEVSRIVRVYRHRWTGLVAGEQNHENGQGPKYRARTMEASREV